MRRGVPGCSCTRLPLQPIDKEQAEQFTVWIDDKDLRELAIIDIIATGEPRIARADAQVDRIRNHKPPSSDGGNVGQGVGIAMP